MRLAGTVCFITGTAGGQGFAAAELFEAEGAVYAIASGNPLGRMAEPGTSRGSRCSWPPTTPRTSTRRRL